jgi:PII-like signaling protein
MQGSLLRFYVHEYQRVNQRLVWEWLLRQADRLSIHGGVAVRTMAGCGRRQALREQHFIEPTGSFTIQVDFMVNDEEADRLLEVVRQEKIRVFFARIPAQFGILNADAPE